jgi:hypothetical protein
MFPDFEERPSDSPLVERIWRSHSERAASFTSISAVCWSMVISKCQGRITISLHGPETGATCKDFPAELEWFGINFKLGAFMPHIPPGSVMDGCITLPDAADHSFWLCCPRELSGKSNAPAMRRHFSNKVYRSWTLYARQAIVTSLISPDR